MTTDTSTALDKPAEPDALPYRYGATLAAAIERRWQDRWENEGTFHAPNPSGPWADPSAAGGEKVYLLDMFPYPSGSGLHVGHPLGFIGTDVLGRYLRMTGRTVLHAMGFDAFGLPAEQYAVQTGTHPRKTTEDNVRRYRAQLRRLGLGHDERRSVATTDIEFYRWTQWIFLQIYNSWYDGTRARPIGELEAEFAAGARPTPDGRAWHALSEHERRGVVDGYRLVYVSEAPVNWCPALGTVLANEEVTAEGRSDRGNFPVFRRSLKQWMMRITAYADRLVADLDRLDWPDSIKTMQRNWIGRSEGAVVRFGTATGSGSPADIEVFTTRPDTLFGATYIVLAPEHPLVASLTPLEWPEGTDERWTGGAGTPALAVEDYRFQAGRKSDLDRQEYRDKTGVFTGAHAINPVNGQPIPVFVADYVLMGYGTGAIMAVPGQDQRDWDFATAFGLPIVRTVAPSEGFDGEAFTGDGPAINSANAEISLDGMGVAEAKRAITDWLVARGDGEATVEYKLRDWLFSRQRYWGEPFPIVWDAEGLPVGLPDDRLPVELPEIEDYSPKTYAPDAADTEPEPPLSRAEQWVAVDLDLGGGPQPYRRETNTMPQWAGSCWYYLRYLDPENHDRFVDVDVERYWMGKDPARGADDTGGVDLYVGGVEHGVLHLLYARFWHKVLFDLGHVTSEEPFRRLFNQGYIQAFAYTDARGVYVPAEEVVETEAGGFTWNGQPVRREYGKMGKSLHNVVTPDEMCERYGGDTFRLYEMSTGPMDVSRPWATRDVIGSHRFLQRVWRNLVDERTGELRVTDVEPDLDTLRALHRAIAGVHADYVALHYNTAAAKLIELNNHLTKVYGGDGVPRAVAEPLVLMMAPLTPHIAEELWAKLGHDGSLAHGPFPVADERYLVADTVEYPIQINGKVRSRVTVPADASAEDVQSAVLADEKVVATLAGREPRKLIVVPGRLVNVVI